MAGWPRSVRGRGFGVVVVVWWLGDGFTGRGETDLRPGDGRTLKGGGYERRGPRPSHCATQCPPARAQGEWPPLGLRNGGEGTLVAPVAARLIQCANPRHDGCLAGRPC